MPANPSPEPITRVDLNLYVADVEYLKSKIGSGWTTWIREIVRTNILKAKRTSTVGEIFDEG